jgi:hypothetical protein
MTGCLKVNCPFKHFKPRNVNSTGNSVASTLTTQPAGKIRQTDIVSGFNVDNCVVVGVVQPAIPITQATIMQTSQKGKECIKQIPLILEDHLVNFCIRRPVFAYECERII